MCKFIFYFLHVVPCGRYGEFKFRLWPYHGHNPLEMLLQVARTNEAAEAAPSSRDNGYSFRLSYGYGYFGT